ncbi:MAG TPA: FecR family protein [Polyangiaceae bacterium]
MNASSRDSAAAEAARLVEVTWPASRLERNLTRVHQRAGRAAVRPLQLALVGALAVAAAVVLLLRVWSPPAASVALPQPARPVASHPPSDPSTTFADGSLARVSEGGELVVKSATPERIESVLTRGAAEFEVTKHAQREFWVLAGPVQVRVVGTRFRVERLGERTRVSVTVGKVEVREGEARSYLEAGESRFFPTRAEQPEAAPSAGRARFLELTRGGEFKAAYQVMSQNPAVVGAGAEDLMLAADAARLSNHPEEAAKYLRRVTSEHPRDSRAPLAAFTLGRVLLSQLSRPGEAAEAFALSRKLRPSGGLSEDALAREAEARAAAGARARAGVLAREYVARYPQGKHRSTMQRLATAP